MLLGYGTRPVAVVLRSWCIVTCLGFGQCYVYLSEINLNCVPTAAGAMHNLAEWLFTSCQGVKFALPFCSGLHYHISSVSHGTTHCRTCTICGQDKNFKLSIRLKFWRYFSTQRCQLVDFLTIYVQVQLANDAISPRLAATKVLIQSILSSLSPHRSYKKKTASLAQQAVHVAVRISALIETTNDLPQLVRHYLTQFEE